MKQLALIVALAAALVTPAVVHAQPAEAIGRPLADGTLPPGTVTVRVIAGAPNAAVAGAEVVLDVNGVPRSARTDSAGRAKFADLPTGATVQAKITDADNKEVTSEAFPLPESGGVKLMLSTKPFGGGAAEAPRPMAGGGGAPPPPRQMSGQPRPDREVPAGTYQVRLTYNSLTIANGKATDPAPPPADSPITLVGYHADQGVTVRIGKTTPDGLVRFDALDVTGATVYFALARLTRGQTVDRLISRPLQPDTSGGAKGMLSGEKLDSGTPAVDELAPGAAALPPGRVRVVLDGAPEANIPITLVDAATKKVVSTTKHRLGAPDPRDFQASGGYEADAAVPPGTIHITMMGGAGAADQPLVSAPVRALPADGDPAAPGIAGTTGADGTLTLTVPPATPVRLVLSVNGRDITSDPFEVQASGGKFQVMAVWGTAGKAEATFDIPYDPAQVLYAETTMRGQYYRSQPFQTLASAGAQIALGISPRMLFNFDLESFVEDEVMGFRGSFILENYSWIPFKASDDGFLVPLPRGFKGGIIHENFQDQVSVVPGEGLRILRPIGPGSFRFIAGFTMPSDGGVVTWSLDLPLGTWGSSLLVKTLPGMDVKLPSGVKGRYVDMKDGGPQQYLVSEIRIMAQQSMVLSISGMPSQPQWKVWTPRIAGVVVVMLLLGGIAYAVMFTRSPRQRAVQASAHQVRREKLLEELVELERTGGDLERREKLVLELERIWD